MRLPILRKSYTTIFSDKNKVASQALLAYYEYVMEVLFVLAYYIKGGIPLKGKVTVHGAKNAALPVMAAAVMCTGETVIENCPPIGDVSVMEEILLSLGCGVKREDNRLILNCDNVSGSLGEEFACRIRGSILLLGPLAARTGFAEVPRPGGCRIGTRPVDIHTYVMERLGYKIRETASHICCERIKEAADEIVLPYPSVGATENAAAAACLCGKDIVLRNCAAEPEISCLCDFLKSAGAEIEGDGKRTIHIKGGKKLYGMKNTLMGDRIEAATYLVMAASTGGEIELEGIKQAHIADIVSVLEKAGAEVLSEGDGIRVKASGRLRGAGRITTGPYPMFSTDIHPLAASLMAVSEGESVIEENVFENRFAYIKELKKMGAHIEIFHRKAIIKGVEKLYGAQVTAPDLRGGAALVAAALAAEGESIIEGENIIKRGYLSFDETIRSLDGNICQKQ